MTNGFLVQVPDRAGWLKSTWAKHLTLKLPSPAFAPGSSSLSCGEGLNAGDKFHYLLHIVYMTNNRFHSTLLNFIMGRPS